MTEFPRNVWYMAGWSEEIGGAFLSRRICGRRLLLFRKTVGDAAALDDRCPHRFAPLSMGVRDGDRIACGYHGLVFDATGACVHNPFSDRIPGRAKVRSYPVVERHSIVWVWLGDPEKTDPPAIPDFSHFDVAPGRKVLRGYTHMKANYEFGTDNLLDLSHIEFVHRGSLGGERVIFAGKHSVVEEDETLHSNWWIPNIPPPGVVKDIYPPDTRVDHWLDMRWNAPASMFLKIGATPTGAARGDGFEVPQAHILTPEDESRTHYFWANSRTQDIDSADVDAMLERLFHQAFVVEDKPMIEGAYDNLEGGDFWAQQPLSLGIDAGGVRARRMLQRLITREQQELGLDGRQDVR